MSFTIRVGVVELPEGGNLYAPGERRTRLSYSQEATTETILSASIEAARAGLQRMRAEEPTNENFRAIIEVDSLGQRSVPEYEAHFQKSTYFYASPVSGQTNPHFYGLRGNLGLPTLAFDLTPGKPRALYLNASVFQENEEMMMNALIWANALVTRTYSDTFVAIQDGDQFGGVFDEEGPLAIYFWGKNGFVAYEASVHTRDLDLVNSKDEARNFFARLRSAVVPVSEERVQEKTSMFSGALGVLPTEASLLEGRVARPHTPVSLVTEAEIDISRISTARSSDMLVAPPPYSSLFSLPVPPNSPSSTMQSINESPAAEARVTPVTDSSASTTPSPSRN